jgi:hypothetical protein
MEKEQVELENILLEIKSNENLLNIIKSGFGEISLKIQDHKLVLIEYSIKVKPQT